MLIKGKKLLDRVLNVLYDGEFMSFPCSLQHVA